LIRTQGLVLVGDLSESQLISEKNSRLSNKLGVLRSPVAQQAYASWIELGINVLPFLGGQNQDTSLVPFVLWESYDTMYRVDAGMVDDPRFARKVTRFGLFYQPNPTIVLKIDAGTRSFGANQYRSENEIRLTTGFTF
jgi:hypothetical protein